MTWRHVGYIDTMCWNDWRLVLAPCIGEIGITVESLIHPVYAFAAAPCVGALLHAFAKLYVQLLTLQPCNLHSRVLQERAARIATTLRAFGTFPFAMDKHSFRSCNV